MRTLFYSFLLGATTLGAAGCSADSGGESSESTESAFRSWGTSSVLASTIASSRQPTINVCLSGRVSAPDLERAQLWTRRSMFSWLRVAKAIDSQVTGNLAFDCTARHLTINLRGGAGTSFAQPSVVTVYMSRPYGTWTHELGHAYVGLVDTYSGRQAGACQAGQPQSLMCWGAYGPRANAAQWSTLWADDVAGLKANYAKVFGATLTPSTWLATVNFEGPVDVDAPWPVEPSPVVIVPVGAPMNMDVEIVEGPATAIAAADDPRSTDL